MLPLVSKTGGAVREFRQRLRLIGQDLHRMLGDRICEPADRVMESRRKGSTEVVRSSSPAPARSCHSVAVLPDAFALDLHSTSRTWSGVYSW